MESQKRWGVFLTWFSLLSSMHTPFFVGTCFPSKKNRGGFRGEHCRGLGFSMISFRHNHCKESTKLNHTSISC